MAVDTSVADKEVLAFLIRVSNAAQTALKSLNNGTPYDAVRLIRLVAKLDINTLNVLVRVPNYESVRPYHIELVNECRAILALSQQALQEVSAEFKTWPPEKIVHVKTALQEALGELDKELKAEKEVKHWLQQATQAFSNKKSFSYSRLYLENTLSVLNQLVQNDNALRQSAERFSKIFRAVKHQDPKKLFEDSIRRRLKVRAVVKFVLENAFDMFAFLDHDWRSKIGEIAELPQENITELEAIRQQVLGSMSFAKANVQYVQVRQMLERLVALSRHARMIEKAVEAAEVQMKEKSKTEEELLIEFWEKNVHGGMVYHGTSSIFISNIERFGLSSEGFGSENNPFKPEEFEFFLAVARKAYGHDAPHLEYFTKDVTQGFFLDANYHFAVNYAKRGSERVWFMMGHIRDMEKEFRQGMFAGRVSQAEIGRLLQILQRYKEVMSHHRPVILHISLSSPALLNVLSQNGLTYLANLISSYDAFKQHMLAQVEHVKTASQAIVGVQLTTTLARQLAEFNPVYGSFHNRPLKGTIPWASITKAEYV